MSDAPVRKAIAALLLGGSLLVGPMVLSAHAQSDPSDPSDPGTTGGTTTGGTTTGGTVGATTTGSTGGTLPDTGGDFAVLLLGAGGATAAALGARHLGRRT